MTDSDIEMLRCRLVEVHQQMHDEIIGMSETELVDLARKTLSCPKVGPTLTEAQEKAFISATED